MFIDKNINFKVTLIVDNRINSYNSMNLGRGVIKIKF